MFWVLWLVAGPTEAGLRWILGKVVSVTTDQGNEIGLGVVPDIVPCFMRWLQGRNLTTMARSVPKASRMMPRAIRIVGWNHTLGNIMRQSVEKSPEWQKYNKYIRALCKLFRNESNRRHLQRLLRPRHPELQLEVTLEHFSASLAKWRFETSFTCMRALLKLRALCENVMDEALFLNPQDKETVSMAMEACKCPKFWKWMAATFAEVIDPLERCRRWGLGCICHPSTPGQKHKRARCQHSGRKLPFAYDKACEVAAKLGERATQVGHAECGGDDDVVRDIRYILYFASDQLALKTRCLNSFPWNLARSGEKAVAADILKQSAENPPEDLYAKEFLAKFKSSLENVAAGGPPSDAHAKALMQLATCSLDESAAEGIHRETSMRRRRAWAARLPWLKSGLRLQQNVARVYRWISTYGDAGRKVIMFEWYMAKRVLRSKPRRRWRPLKLQDLYCDGSSHIV